MNNTNKQNKSTEAFTMIPNHVFKLKVKPSSKLVLMFLMSFKNAPKGIFPSIRFMAKETNLSDRTVQDAIKELKDNGLVTYESSNGMSNRYSVVETATVNLGVAETATGVVEIADGVSKNCLGGVADSADGCSNSCVGVWQNLPTTNNIINNNTNNNVQTRAREERHQERKDDEVSISVAKERYMVLEMIKGVTVDSKGRKCTKYIPDYYVSHIGQEIDKLTGIIQYMKANGITLDEDRVMESPHYVRNRLNRMEERIMM